MAAQTVNDHLRAAWQLALRRGSAIDEFVNSPEAVWYSFIAAIIALPLFFTTLVLGGESERGVAGYLAELGPYAVGWLLFPVVMAKVAETIDRERFYCRYITAVNWCALVEFMVMTATVVVQALGILPSEFGNILFFVVVVWVLTYQYFVAKNALEVESAVAALVVGLRLVLDLVIVAFSGAFGG
jgi:hypothetical protein